MLWFQLPRIFAVDGTSNTLQRGVGRYLGPCKTHVGYLLDCTFQIANIQLSRLDLILNLMLIMLMTMMMTMMILLTRMTSVSNSAGVRIFKFCFRVVTPPSLPPCASPPYHYHQ